MTSKVPIAVVETGSLGQEHARVYAELAVAGKPTCVKKDDPEGVSDRFSRNQADKPRRVAWVATLFQPTIFLSPLYFSSSRCFGRYLSSSFL